MSKVVADHYNSAPNQGLSGRNLSRIVHLRNFNNWIKSMLIAEHFKLLKQNKAKDYQFKVFDMCCGKGGDLLKWTKENLKYLLACDIASNSVETYIERYEAKKKKIHNMFPAEFVVADLTKERLRDKVKMPVLFDIVSCQFAFHYSFESLPQVECMLRNASENLAIGGYFIGTMPNAYDIVSRLRKAKSNSISNSVYSINYDGDIEDKIPLFGAKYQFLLDGVVDCPEFLVHMPTLERIAKKYGLKKAKVQRFQNFYEFWKFEGKWLLSKMNGLETYPALPNGKLAGHKADYKHARDYLREFRAKKRFIGTLSYPEWEVASLYITFSFEKVSNQEIP